MEDRNPILESTVDKNESELKSWLVNYVREKTSPKNGDVTVENIIDVMAEEFPEFLMALAEENWIRGYRQGVEDSEAGVRAALEAAGIDPSEQKIIIPPEEEQEEPAAEDE